jgi:P27 family predicted phage terminase small subunit
MASTGPKPQPTKLKLLNGVVNKKRINNKEPKPAPKVPPIPKGRLDAKGRKEWKRMGKALERLGVLSEVDGGTFEALIVSYMEWCKYSKMAQDKPLYKSEKTGYVQISPMVTLADKAFKNYIKMACEFGLTPSSRSRIVINKDVDDDMSDFFT